MPALRPWSRAPTAALADELASFFASLAVPGSTPMSFSHPSIVVLASERCAPRSSVSLVMPPMTTTTTSAARTTPESSRSAAPAARGTRWRASQLTTGEATDAITAAAITGVTIVWVSAMSQTAPTISTPRPTSSHAVRPRSRSQPGAAETIACPPRVPAGSPSAMWPGSQRRRTRPGCCPVFAGGGAHCAQSPAWDDARVPAGLDDRGVQSQALAPAYGQELTWQPAKPRLRPGRLVVAWIVAGASVYVAALLVPGFSLERPGAAFVVAAVIAVFNAVLPPIVAALRLPFTLALGFLLVLGVNAVALMLADELLPSFGEVDSFGIALLAALVMSAVAMVLQVMLGTNDHDEYSLRVVRRVAGRQGRSEPTDVPGIIFLEIDGLALPVLRRAMRDGNAPVMARWMEENGYRLTEWETDLSSQTGASQAGILLGSNEDITAFRWVEKETGTMMVCSSPEDCAEIERRRSTGIGLLADGGASRGNLLSGEAEETILTVSRMEAEKGANPGYRAFLADGVNVTRAFVLFVWEVLLEWTAAGRAARRDVRPRGHRGGYYPFLRGAMCVIVRNAIVFGVLTDMMRGRPAVYATFSSYDEVAHHSGIERADTLEALRKLDQQFDALEYARRYAPRPYEIVVLSDHGQTQGATFKQRNGYGLDELVERSLEATDVAGIAGGDEQRAMVGNAMSEATGAKPKKRPKNDVSDRQAVVMGSGNLGLIYLMEEQRRLTLEEIDERHPRLVPALREHPHVGWLLVRSAERGPVVLGPDGERNLATGQVVGEDPLAPFSATAARHLLRTDGFAHVADILVGSFYDPERDEGCAFEELIAFHGGLGGLQTRPFILHPESLPVPDEPIIGAAAVHGLLLGWRRSLQG